MLSLITTTDWTRLALLYSHLVLCAFAITAVLRADIAIMSGRYTRESLATTAKSVAILLTGLWVTGLGIIYIDTGFSPDILMTKSKLLLKLLCVIMLTINGVVLHRLSFPLMSRSHPSLSVRESVLLVITGALSTSHWMLAAFVGMSKPLARLPLDALIAGYGVFLGSVLVSSLFFIPLLRMRASSQQGPAAQMAR